MLSISDNQTGKSIEEILFVFRRFTRSIALACAAFCFGASAQSVDYAKLYDFSEASTTVGTVAQPIGAPIAVSGKFYGVSYYGGPNGCNSANWQCGTFFELKPAVGGGSYTETTLYEFLTGVDGMAANANPIYAGNGTFYGTTYGGGCPTIGACNGTAYSIVLKDKAAATKTTLYEFQGGGDGSRPTFLTTLGGKIYGITNFGGSANAGVVFELTPGGSPVESVIHSFDGAAEGSYAQYIVGYNNALYISLCYSGAYDGGTIVKLTPPAAPGDAWQSTVIFSFGGYASSAWNPEGISFGPDGDIYGSLQLGGGGSCASVYGKYPGCGAIFQLAPPISGRSWNYTQIYGFQGRTDSGSPYGPPSYDASGDIYVTSTGTLVSPKSFGAIVRLAPRSPGVFGAKMIHTFVSADAADPAGMLTEDSTGTMYGFATYGGSANDGAFFSLTPVAP